MTTLQKILRIICFFGLAIFGLFSVVVMVSLPHEIKRNVTLANSFTTAASWIDDFIDSNGRMPNSTEYEAWASVKPKYVYGIQSINIINPASSGSFKEAIDSFGSPPSSSTSYILAIWTGEWNEYYASWVKKSTLDNSPRYYGLIIAFGVFSILAACGCGFMALFKLHPTRGSIRTA